MAQKNRGEMMKLVRRLRREGFAVDRTGSGHWMVKAPDGAGSTVLSFSPGAGGLKQTLSQLRKIGYDGG